MYDSSKLFSDFCNGPKYAFESFLSHIINLAVFLTLSKTHVQKELQNPWKLNKCSQYFFRHTIQYYKFPCHFNFKSIDIRVYYLKLNRATVHSSQKDFTLERRLFCGWTSFQARLTQSDLRPRSFVSAQLRWHFTFVHLRSFQLSLTYSL